MEAQTTTLIIAIWGAFLSTVVFGWNLYRDLSDRGRLRVYCYMGLTVMEGVGIEKENLLVWHITNVGRRPVLLTHVGGSFKGPNFMLNTPKTKQLPVILEPGHYFSDFMEDLTTFDYENLKALTATDSLGRTFKASRKQLKKVKEDLKELKNSSKSRD